MHRRIWVLEQPRIARPRQGRLIGRDNRAQAGEVHVPDETLPHGGRENDRRNIGRRVIAVIHARPASGIGHSGFDRQHPAGKKAVNRIRCLRHDMGEDDGAGEIFEECVCALHFLVLGVRVLCILNKRPARAGATVAVQKAVELGKGLEDVSVHGRPFLIMKGQLPLSKSARRSPLTYDGMLNHARERMVGHRGVIDRIRYLDGRLRAHGRSHRPEPAEENPSVLFN